MKVFIVIFSLFITPFAFSQGADLPTPSIDEMASYIDELVEKGAQPVTCANILEAVEEYFNLSQTNQTLLTVSANRLQGVLPSDTERTPAETEAVSKDINRAVYSIGDSQAVLSDKVFDIMKALPGCLKE